MLSHNRTMMLVINSREKIMHRHGKVLRIGLVIIGISGEFNERSFVSHYPCDTAGRALIGFLAAARGEDAAGARRGPAGADAARRRQPSKGFAPPPTSVRHRVRYEDMIASLSWCGLVSQHNMKRTAP
jgi:hypothetical protein